MKCAVIDIRGKSRKKLGNFLITLYILNLTDLFFTKFLLWKAPDLFREANSFMKLIINVPLSYTREYLEDLDENTLPNIGDTVIVPVM